MWVSGRGGRGPAEVRPGSPAAEVFTESFPPLKSVFVCRVGAGAKREDLVVDTVGKTVEQDAGGALQPVVGCPGRWCRAQDGGEPGGQDPAVTEGVGQLAVQCQCQALFGTFAGGNG